VDPENPGSLVQMVSVGGSQATVLVLPDPQKWDYVKFNGGALNGDPNETDPLVRAQKITILKDEQGNLRQRLLWGEKDGGNGTVVQTLEMDVEIGSQLSAAVYDVQVVIGAVSHVMSNALNVIKLDLDVYSDNTTASLNYPDTSAGDRGPDEETIEEQSPVRIAISNDDSDEDNLPGFADGIGLVPGDNPDPRLCFEPMVLDIPRVDVSKAKLRFVYSGSDTARVSSQTGPDRSPRWVPASGHLRIWKKNGSVQRNPSSADAGGDYVAPNQAYTLAQLGILGTSSTVTLYLEGINDEAARDSIRVELDLQGDGRWQFSDTVCVEYFDMSVLNNPPPGAP